jgi:hypothetical protein
MRRGEEIDHNSQHQYIMSHSSTNQLLTGTSVINNTADHSRGGKLPAVCSMLNLKSSLWELCGVFMTLYKPVSGCQKQIII